MGEIKKCVKYRNIFLLINISNFY